MQYEAKFLSIAVATVQNFNEIVHKKGHKKISDIFQNSFLTHHFLFFSQFRGYHICEIKFL